MTSLPTEKFSFNHRDTETNKEWFCFLCASVSLWLVFSSKILFELGHRIGGGPFAHAGLPGQRGARDAAGADLGRNCGEVERPGLYSVDAEIDVCRRQRRRRGSR